MSDTAELVNSQSLYSLLTKAFQPWHWAVRYCRSIDWLEATHLNCSITDIFPLFEL